MEWPLIFLDGIDERFKRIRVRDDGPGAIPEKGATQGKPAGEDEHKDTTALSHVPNRKTAMRTTRASGRAKVCISNNVSQIPSSDAKLSTTVSAVIRDNSDSQRQLSRSHLLYILRIYTVCHRSKLHLI